MGNIYRSERFIKNQLKIAVRSRLGRRMFIYTGPGPSLAKLARIRFPLGEEAITGTFSGLCVGYADFTGLRITDIYRLLSIP